MIDRIIHFSLHHRMIVLLGTLAVIVGGLVASQKMDIDVFPDLTAPTVVVMTDCNGMAAEETERLVTFPIESALNGATNVRRVRSASFSGYSYVWAEFDWGMDVFRARQIVSEKMATLTEQLPEGVMPQLAPQSSVMGEILFVGLKIKKVQNESPTSLMELRSLADWVIKPVILATGGVSQVTVIGGDYKEYQVLADPYRMKKYGVTFTELSDVVSAMSRNAEGGVMRDYGNEYALRGLGRTNDIDALNQTPIKDKVTVGDVARIETGAAQKMGMASLDGEPAIILSISKQPNINTLEVTRKIESQLENVKKSLPMDVVLDTHIFRQADFIEASVDNVGRSLVEGAVLCITILFLFLRSVRTTIISVLAIPLSLLGTLIVLWLLGMEINTMTLGGMCIAIGSLVDDAIIDVENVHKRLREQAATRLQKVDIIFHASKEIRSSIMNATLIVIVAFTPMFFLSGMEGRMLKPLGITYIVALFMSLIVAMTVTPLLCRMMLKAQTEESQKAIGWVNKMQQGYGQSLEWALKHGRMVLGATIVLLVGALWTMATFGSSFLPAFNEGALTITAACKPGVSLWETNRVGNLLEKRIHEVPEVVSTSRRTGRGELDEHSQTTNSSEIDVNFDETRSGRNATEITNDIRERLADVPGVACIVGQPIGHRIDHMMSGTRASIAIKLFGPDLTELYVLGQKIKQIITPIEGCVDINVDQQIETPQIHLKPNRLALARYGMTMDDFNKTIPLISPEGQVLGDVYEGQRRYDLTLKVDTTYTGRLNTLGDILIPLNKKGNAIPLADMADITSSAGPSQIAHENVQRKLVVAANVSGRDVGSVVADIQKEIDEEIQLPEGYRIEYGGQFESAQSATRTLVLTTLLALIIIYILLVWEFKSLSLSSIVMLGLPLALIGGVAAIAVSSWTLSIPSIIGFITLFGIATRNGILLISRLRHDNNIIAGAKDRINPILMTALTSALALIPMILESDKAGNEIQSPMAIVVLGGLLTSTLLNLYVMPVIYEIYTRHTTARH